jgi:chromosome segregation ATPase
MAEMSDQRLARWRRTADLDARAGAPVGAALREAAEEVERLQRDAAEWRTAYDRLSARATRLWQAWQSARRGRARMRRERDEARAEVAATAARWTEHADKQSAAIRKAEAELAAAQAAVERLRRELREAGR